LSYSASPTTGFYVYFVLPSVLVFHTIWSLENFVYVFERLGMEKTNESLSVTMKMALPWWSLSPWTTPGECFSWDVYYD
jgi:hypothetical protein